MQIYSILVFNLLLLISPGCVAEAITLGLAEENAGIIDYDGEQFHGSLATYANCIFNNTEHKVSIHKAPHARLLKMLTNGTIDIAAPFTKTINRDRYATFAGKLSPITMNMVFPKRYGALNKHDFGERVLDRGYVVKRGMDIREYIAEEVGLPLQKISTVEQQTSSWVKAVEMVKLGRAAFTVVPDKIYSRYQQPHQDTLTYKTSHLVYPSFYVSNTNLRYQQQFLTAVSRCQTQSQAKGSASVGINL